jgi:hypothetical protein
MRGFLIDTNVLSEYNRASGPDMGVKRWLESRPRELQYVSVITLAEIEKGIGLLSEGRRRAQLEDWFKSSLEGWFRGRILSIDRQVAHYWASILVATVQGGRTLPTLDSLIAATALANDLTIVTRNVKDFAPTGALTVNPWESP